MFLTCRLGGFLRQGPFHVKHLFILSSKSNYPHKHISCPLYKHTYRTRYLCFTPKQVLEWECHVEIMRTECHYLNGRARFSQMCEHWTRLLVMWMALRSWGWGPVEDGRFSPHHGRAECDSGEKPLTSNRSPLIHLCLFQVLFSTSDYDQAAWGEAGMGESSVLRDAVQPWGSHSPRAYWCQKSKAP